jgi:hypothetical protein
MRDDTEVTDVGHACVPCGVTIAKKRHFSTDLPRIIRVLSKASISRRPNEGCEAYRQYDEHPDMQTTQKLEVLVYATRRRRRRIVVAG